MINKQIATHTCKSPTNISKTVIYDRLDFRKFLTYSHITKIIELEAGKLNWRN